MLSFNQFRIELSEATDKNTHMQHIEDAVLYGGVEGTRQAITALRSLRDMLAGKSNQKVDVTVKWDGAPAIFAGIDPRDGKFFVAKKGIFNKTPKVYKTAKEIDADTSGDLADKLKIALVELAKLGITGVIQGDIMFTKNDLKQEEIDGEEYITFQPNTIVYAVPANSSMATRLKAANIGVVFHTSYSGKDFESMKASYNIDISSLKRVASVWYQDAGLRDITGKGTLTASETADVNQALSTAGTIFQKISSTTIKQVQNNPELARTIEQYNNTLVRKGEEIGNTKDHVNNLIAWINDKFSKEVETRKTEKGKGAVEAHRKEFLSFFSKENKANLDLMFQLQNALVHAKKLIISKMDSLKNMGTFLRTQDGFKVTGQEGFVAIDKIGGGAVKIVDRLQFSTANFSPDIIKGWQR